MRRILLGLLLALAGLAAIPAGFGAAYWFDVQRPDVSGPAVAVDPAAEPTLLAPREKTIPLGEAYPELAAGRGHVFRARKLVLAPGAETASISHAGRPAITYVAHGEVVERREGAEPRRLQAGEHTLDRVDVVHSFGNTGAGPAVLLIGEILPAAEAQP